MSKKSINFDKLISFRNLVAIQKDFKSNIHRMDDAKEMFESVLNNIPGSNELSGTIDILLSELHKVSDNLNNINQWFENVIEAEREEIFSENSADENKSNNDKGVPDPGDFF